VQGWLRASSSFFIFLGSPLATAWAQPGIYTCTPGQGRAITSDRPITECLDREQRELNPSGTVRRTIGPSLTAPERAALEARERQAALKQARIAEEKRRERALLVRYPNQAMHDKERAEAVQQVDVVIQAAQKRVDQLQTERKRIDAELEFYQKDPSKAPPELKRQAEDNLQSLNVQKRFIADQDSEKKRIHTRFDAELARLRPLWAPAAASAGPAR